MGRPGRAARQASDATWQPWLCWEALLSGGAPPAAQGPTPLAAAAHALAAALAGTEAGERARFEDAARTLLAVAPPVLQPEAADLLAAIDPARDASGAVAAWRDGAADALPHGLEAVGFRADDAQGATAALVLAGPGAPGRRVLRVGRALAQPDRHFAVSWPASQRRSVAGIAALALAGPGGLDLARFFASVYGFAYAGAAHTGMLDVLLHRMRGLCEGFGTVRRDGDRVALARPVAVPDPRSERPPEARLAHELAQAGPGSTATLPRALGLPLRTVQLLVRRLVDDGACREIRDGRSVRYQMEDTTFSEPTDARARPRG